MAQCRVAFLTGLWDKATNASPARTVSVLGLKDSGQPDLLCHVGSTPGPVGWWDAGDPAVGWLPKQPALMGRMCRLSDGVLSTAGPIMSLAAPAQTIGEITLLEAQTIALQVTTAFEGGTSMNYAALAGDFDGQATSYGLIQWNFGQGTLGPLLNKMRAASPAAFKGCFSEDADYDTLLAALVSGSSTDQADWARDLQASAAGKAAWRAAFVALAGVESFRQIQRAEAAAEYHPEVKGCVSKLRTLDSALMKNISLRTYVALFDLCVQQHNLNKAWDQIKAEVAAQKPTTQLALVEIAVVERAKKASDAWVADCMSRRLGIISGQATESTAHDVVKKRVNAQFELLQVHGSKKVLSL